MLAADQTPVALDDPTTGRFVRAFLFVAFTYVFLANAWMGDDAYITFRAAWNLVHGYGFTFNPSERVLAFTNPLWGLTVAAAYFVTREFFFTVTALSWVLDLAAGAVLARQTRPWPVAVVLVGWLLSSKALVDYSSSGLEYPLSYLFVALFFARYLRRHVEAGPASPTELRWYVLIAALAFVNRQDTILLFAFPLAHLLLTARRRPYVPTARAVLLGASPAMAWLLFATFYYGFPLPNTLYAKVANGVPAFLQRSQGLAYLFNSLRFDPITLGSVALALLVGWRQRGAARWAACSALLSVAYSVNVGGDFMGGRFFSLPFLASVAVIVPSMTPALIRPAAAALVLYNVLVPVAPIKTFPGHEQEWPWRTQNGIKDEMGITHPDSNILSYAPFRTLPDTPFAREGLSFGASDRRASIYCCIGMYGLNAGPSKHVIDNNALSDPLLARLPVSPMVFFDFWASHYFRDVPEGYLESNERDRNLLTDPVLHGYYDRLRNVTRGSVWRWSRLADIWELNVGESRHIGRVYESHRAIDLSVRASHAKFHTDLGTRDEARGTLTAAAGRAGFLEFGPDIPLKAGTYRVRWKGQAQASPGTSLGHVEVWNGDRLVSRQPVTAGAPDPQGVLAFADFTLRTSAQHLDYRFYTSGAVPVTLERIELVSGSLLPPKP